MRLLYDQRAEDLNLACCTCFPETGSVKGFLSDEPFEAKGTRGALLMQPSGGVSNPDPRRSIAPE